MDGTPIFKRWSAISILICLLLYLHSVPLVEGACNTTACSISGGNDRYGQPRDVCCHYFETESCCSQAENNLFDLYFQLTLGLSIAMFVIILIIIIIVVVVCCQIYKCIKCFLCCGFCCCKD